MWDDWSVRTREWLSRGEKLLALPEQEFAGWTLDRAIRSPLTGWLVATICGEEGSGKSALVRQALRRSADIGKRTIVADADEWLARLSDETPFAERFPIAGRTSVIVWENLHRIGERDDGLATLLDLARQERIPVIVTCTGLPSQIGNLSSRLVNRLHGGIVAGIRPLSEESQRRLTEFWISQGIVEPLAGGRLINPPVTTAGQLRAALSTRSRTGTAELQGEVLLDLVAELVAKDFAVPVAELCSGTRTQGLKIPRGVAMSLSRELTNYPLATIGRYFGGRSHTSVVRSCSRLQQLLPEVPSLRQQVQELRAKLRRKLSRDCG